MIKTPEHMEIKCKPEERLDILQLANEGEESGNILDNNLALIDEKEAFELFNDSTDIIITAVKYLGVDPEQILQRLLDQRKVIEELYHGSRRQKSLAAKAIAGAVVRALYIDNIINNLQKERQSKIDQKSPCDPSIVGKEWYHTVKSVERHFGKSNHQNPVEHIIDALNKAYDRRNTTVTVFASNSTK